jgi:hypothetical protein
MCDMRRMRQVRERSVGGSTVGDHDFVKIVYGNVA